MIRKIELINFMSHSHTVIEPADGLTVLIGENNCGKSAVVCALQALCRNAHGDYMVRHGERECSVSAETDDGHTIVWRRSGNTVTYVIDGLEIGRLHGKIPDNLHEFLKLPLVETEGLPFDIHFGEQKKPIFLLDETPNRRATFFASSSDSAKLLAMQGLHNRKVRDAKARERALSANETRLARRLNTLESIDAAGDRLGEIETDFETITRTAAQAGVLRELIAELCNAETEFNQWTASVSALSPLTAPPEQFPIEPLGRLIGEIEDAAKREAYESAKSGAFAKLEPRPEMLPVEPLRELIGQSAMAERRVRYNSAVGSTTAALAEPPAMWDTSPISEMIGEIRQTNLDHLRLGRQVVTLYGLDAPPELEDTQRLAAMIADIREATANADRLGIQSEALSRCRPLPEFHDTRDLTELISLIERAETENANRTRLENALTAVSPPPQMADLSDLGEMIGLFETTQNELDDLNREVDTVKKELKKTERELRKCAEKTGSCPTCGRELDADEMLAAASRPTKGAQ